MRKIKIYLELLEAFYGTPGNLKKLQIAFKAFLVLTFLSHWVILAYICLYGGYFLGFIFIYLFLKYWFRWLRNCSKLSTRIKTLEEKDFDCRCKTQLYILIENITYYFQNYQKALEHAEKNFKLDSLKEIRWEIFADKTRLKGVDKYQLLADIEAMITRNEIKKEAAA